ncbi:MAG: sialidase family protein [Myxococcota bacterium]|nr:sialidase family protein [Myxococcota bacterium]
MKPFFVLAALTLIFGCESGPIEPTPFGFVEPPEPVRSTEARDEPTMGTLNESALSERQILFEQAPGQFHSPAQTRVMGSFQRGLDLQDQSPFLGSEYRRTILTDEILVGLDCAETGCIAASRSGGLFRTDTYGDWRAMPSNLPALKRFYIGVDAWIACPLSGRKALLSQDRGQTWLLADFHCSRYTAKTVVNTPEITAVLDGDRLRLGGFFDDLIRWIPAPVEQPECLFVGAGALVVVGRSHVAVSTDGGRTYETSPKAFELAPVRDGVVTDKGGIVVVGDAPAGQSPVAMSHDFGASWVRPPSWPGRDPRADFIARARDGRFAVSKAFGRAHVFVGDPLGVYWSEMAARESSLGPIAPYRSGFLVSTTRGIAVSPSQRGVYRLGLDQPIRDLVAISQHEYIGVGAYGGVYRSHDRGLTWYPAGPGHSLPFTHILHLEGQRLVAAGAGLIGQSDDGGVTWSLHSTENGCSADWLVGGPESHFVGCADGTVLGRRTHHGGWRLLSTPWAVNSTQGVWLPDSESLVLMNVDTDHLLKSTDHGYTWTEVELDAGEPIRALDAVGETLSLRTASGRLAWTVNGTPQWQWLSSERALLGNALAHRRFNDGRWLVLDESTLWRIEAGLQLDAISDSANATGLKLLKSGDIVLLSPQSTTLLSRVSGH